MDIMLSLLLFDIDYAIKERERKIKSGDSIESILYHMNNTLCNKIKPFMLRNYLKESNEYREKRDIKNVKLIESMNDTISTIQTAFINNKNVHIKKMTSLAANMNLIKQSNINIGLLVENLNDDNYENKLNTNIFNDISHIIESIGFEQSTIFNATIHENRYYSYTKKIIIDNDEIEIEIKIRDYRTTIPILNLHNCIDTLPYEDATVYTYVKYLLKETDIENKKNGIDTNYYFCFKRILCEGLFYTIDGKYLL